MELEGIDWAHKPLVEELRRTWGNETSAYAFPSLYIWRGEMELSLFRGRDLFAVRFGMRGENSWFFPCGAPEEARAFVAGLLGQGGPPCRFYYARAAEAQALEDWFPGRFAIQRAPEDDEYLYDRAEQLELKGKAFRHQRNDLHRVREQGGLRVSPITPENLVRCAQVLRGWRARPHSRGSGGLMDVTAGDTLLRQFGPLGISGVLVENERGPAAVAAGYPLTERVYDLCVCKQITPHPETATLARYALLQSLGEAIREINAEEDLGLAGLRGLKEGMRPSRKIEMYVCIQRA